MDFLNGLFVAGAAAALIPVIIHLVQRRRVQQVVFGSLRFLRKTSHRVVHRRRFEEILLVLLRALALAVLAFAFARPFFRKPLEPRVSGKTAVGEEAALVLIDNSYSMQAEGRLERAKAEALKFVREAEPSAKLGVAAYSSQFDELCPVGSKPAQAEEAIRGVQPSWRGTHLALALKQANRLLTRADRNEEYRRIVLIGDFQDSAWEKRADWTLSPGIELSLRNVAQKAVPNVFIGRLAVPRLVVAGGFVEVISATVRNLTDKPLNDALVSFRVNGEEKGTLIVNLRPGEEAPVRFRHTFTEPGDVVGSIAIRAEDDLPEDNAAHFCVHVTPRVHVLLVNADRAEETVRNDGLFLKAALVPAVEGVMSPFDVRETGPEEMKPEDLDGMDVVLFANVSRIPEALVRVPADRQGREGAEFASPLGRFVAAGGGLGFICGKKIVPDDFNRTFGDLAPARLSRLAMADGEPPVVINQTDLRHEIFTEFAQPHTGDFALAEFTQYFLVTDSLRAQVPARFSSRDAHPALLERVFGPAAPPSGTAPPASGLRPSATGKSILFVSSTDLEWNNLCLKSVFVPFVHQVTKRLCARRTGSVRDFTVGDDVTYHLPQASAEVKLRRLAATESVGGPSPARELKLQSAGAGDVVTFSPDKPGIYELSFAGQGRPAYSDPGGSARFAVNLDPAEPDLRPLDTKLLLATVQKGPALESKPTASAVSVAARATVRERMESHQKVWAYLLLATLAILAGEMWLATRIGRV